MKVIDLAFAKPIVDLIGLISEGPDFTDSIGAVHAIGVKDVDGIQKVMNPFQIAQTEGRAGVLRGTTEVAGYGPFGIEIDTQRGTSKLSAGPEFNDLILIIGVETENLNRRPL